MLTTQGDPDVGMSGPPDVTATSLMSGALYLRLLFDGVPTMLSTLTVKYKDVPVPATSGPQESLVPASSSCSQATGPYFW